ncbi:MAG TPA: hypothetical protein VGG19_06595 [Tepidisphaeraceae bacterium]|jgi:hypothetical protein
MSLFMEQLEGREFLSVAPGGPYTGTFSPKGKPAQAILQQLTNNKKTAAHVPATLTLTIASNDLVSGSLTFNGTGTTVLTTYAISGSVIGATVSLNLDSAGVLVGNVDGKITAGDKKITGSMTDTINGSAISGNLALPNTTAKKAKGSGKSSNPALVPGYYPNETPPSIGSGLSEGTTPGQETGITPGNNSSSGVIGGDSGSILG